MGGRRKDRPSDLIVARYDHYTTREGDPNIHTHAVVMNVARARHASNRPAERQWITEPGLDAALARAPHLADEQRDAVRRAASPDGISVIEAGAGTGETTAARAIADAARASGLKIVGLAPSWVAACQAPRQTAPLTP